MPQRRVRQRHSITFHVPHEEYIDAEMERTGCDRSYAVAAAIQFYLDHKVAPEIVQLLIDSPEILEQLNKMAANDPTLDTIETRMAALAAAQKAAMKTAA